MASFNKQNAASTTTSTTAKVCIIGAGISGLQTARVLLNSSNTPFLPDDIIVLEAQNRTGGRIRTDSTSSKIGLQYDIGAAWFHDCLTNSVLSDSITSNSFDVRKDGYFDDKDVCYYSEEFEGKIPTSDLKLRRVVEDIEKFIEIHYSSSLDVKDMSLNEAVDLYISKYEAFLTDEQISLCGRILRYLELWYGIDSTKISAKYAVMSHQGRNFYNKKGFAYLVDQLCSQIDCKILLNQQVKKINRGDLISVTTADGTEIIANYLVVTVPHSILALDEDHPYGIKWRPKLPTPMSESFQSMHFGALGKVILEFEKVWWDSTEDRIYVLSNPESVTSTVSSDPEIQKLKYKPFEYPIYIINYTRVYPGASSLVILTQSPVTDYLEENPHLAWTYMKPMLSKLKVSEVLDPINVIVSDWTVNPFIRGTYSALYVDDDPDDEIIQLSGEHEFCGLGILSNIRFAGEHTIADGAGCVHGAYDSGSRAAQWILEKETQNIAERQPKELLEF